MAVIQCISPCGRGEDGSPKFKASVRMGEEREFKWLWTWWIWLSVPDGLLFWVFHKLLISRDFHHVTTISRLYRERPQKEINTQWDSVVEENAALMLAGRFLNLLICHNYIRFPFKILLHEWITGRRTAWVSQMAGLTRENSSSV